MPRRNKNAKGQAQTASGPHYIMLHPDRDRILQTEPPPLDEHTMQGSENGAGDFLNNKEGERDGED